jgi:hypothetical protein
VQEASNGEDAKKWEIAMQKEYNSLIVNNTWSLVPFPKGKCEAFLHTFNMKICTHKTHLEVELLCNCNLTNKVVRCNAMKFTKNLICCVHLEDTKTLWENRNSP